MAGQELEHIPAGYNFERCATRLGAPSGPYYEADVVAAIRETSGVLADAADLLGRSRTGLCNYIQKHQQLMALMLEYRERLVDVAERQVRSLVEAGDPATVRYVLSTIGRYRGWTLKDWQDKEENPDIPKVQIVLPDNGR